MGAGSLAYQKDVHTFFFFFSWGKTGLGLRGLGFKGLGFRGLGFRV